jgi:hypothetical protein
MNFIGPIDYIADNTNYVKAGLVGVLYAGYYFLFGAVPSRPFSKASFSPGMTISKVESTVV